MLLSNTMRRGFTLVECLSVMGIILMLGAILLPVFSRTKQAARRTECLSNVRQLSDAMMMYLGDNNGCYPLRVDGTDNEAVDQWIDMIHPYVKAGRDGKTSPLSKCSDFVPAAGLEDGYGKKKITGWGYGMNGHLHNAPSPVSESSISDTGLTALIGDSTLGDFYARPRRRARLAYANSSVLSPYDLPCNQVTTRHGTANASQPGRGGSTVSFVDGHVQFLFAEPIMQKLAINPKAASPRDPDFYEGVKESFCMGGEPVGS